MSKEKIKILIVDDDKIARLFLKILLSKNSNYEIVDDVDCAEKAIKICEHNSVDIVLMDLNMDGMNGIVATSKIKAISQNIKVIILTSIQQETEVFAALGAGASAYCTKDYNESMLLNVINYIYNGVCWLDAKISEKFLSHFSKPNEKYELTTSKEYKNKKENSLSFLSPRETEVLKHLLDGKNNTEIGEVLYITPSTVKAHVSKIFEKLNVKGRVEAAVKVTKLQLMGEI